MTKNRTSDEVEDRFLAVAAALFIEKGFDATTVREIAKAAGMLPGSLHYRYPTKSGLLLALMRRGMEADLACIRAAVASSNDPVERVRLALRARVRFLISKDVARVVLFDWRSLRGEALEEMIRLRDGYEAFWKGLLKEAADTGRLRPDLDLRMLRFLIFGTVNWVALWYSPQRGGRSPEEIADAFWEFIAYGVLDVGEGREAREALRALPALAR